MSRLEDILTRLRQRVGPLPERVQIGPDDLDNVAVWVRRDMLHLEADALNDRLHHWTLNELQEVVPGASASVSFMNATPADPAAEGEMDLQEGWLDLEPTLRLDLSPPPSAAEVDAFARIIPRFLALVDAEGRPDGFRQLEVGNVA